MNARPFWIGLAVGAGAVAGCFAAFGSRPTPSPVLATDSERRAGSESLHQQVQRLETALAQARRQVDRASGSPEAVEASMDTSAPVASATTPRAIHALLLDNYRALRDEGYIRQWAESEGGELANFLISRWMVAEQPQRALLLLQQIDGADGFDLSSYGAWIGRTLREKGDGALAATAYLLTLRTNPTEWECVRAMLDLDPATALMVRDQSPAIDSQDESTKRTQDALLMLAAGRSAEALAIIDELIAGEQLAGPAWELLVERAPGEAEKRLAARQLSDGGEIIDNELMLLRSIKSQGRNGDGRERATALLEGELGAPHVALRVAELYPDLAQAWLEQRTLTQPSAEDWGGLGQLFENTNRADRAIQAYLAAWELAPGESDYGRRLLALDTQRTLPTIAQRARAVRDDELLGDIGDRLWEQGRKADAFRYWQEAREIDPGDGEWINKVNAVNQGRNPM